MDRDNGKGHFDRIMTYIDDVGAGHGSYSESIERLRAHPPGFRRSLCIYFSDADIDNGGLDQYYGNGFGCMTMSAIEGYERLGAERMVQIMKSGLFVCFQTFTEYVAYTDFRDVPPAYFDDFVPLASDFEALDALYYNEAERLPGAEDVDSMYPLGVIDYYYENFPEDFSRLT